MNCREALEHFGSLVDGDLGWFARWRLRVHLVICRACRRYLRSYQATVRAETAAFDDQRPSQSTTLSDEQVKSIVAAMIRTAQVPPDDDQA